MQFATVRFVDLVHMLRSGSVEIVGFSVFNVYVSVPVYIIDDIGRFSIRNNSIIKLNVKWKWSNHVEWASFHRSSNLSKIEHDTWKIIRFQN